MKYRVAQFTTHFSRSFFKLLHQLHLFVSKYAPRLLNHTKPIRNKLAKLVTQKGTKLLKIISNSRLWSIIPARLRAHRRKLALFAGALILLVGPTVYLTLIRPNQTKAAPWATTATDWQKRKRLSLINNSGQTLIATTTYSITLNTKELVDAGDLNSDCSDLRIYYQPDENTNTKLAYYFDPASGTTGCSDSEATKLYFPLQASLSNNVTDTEYYLYYDNDSAVSEASVSAFDVGGKQATLVCPFNGDTTCVNSAGAETPTTATGAIRYSGAKSAMSFDGINDTLDSGTDGSLDDLPNSDMTVEGWMYRNTQNGNYPILISKGGTGGWLVRLAGGTSPSMIDFVVNLTSDARTYSSGTSSDQWIHWAVVWDATTKSSDIYLNGVLSNSSKTAGSGTYATDNTSNLTLGAASGSSIYYRGLQDEVRISNIKRYATNFTPQTTPFVRDEYTKLLLHFDENGDDPRNTGKAIDDSGNANHGTITGAKYVSGLVGVDASATDTGKAPSQSYASHEGVFIEEGTTNKITNPSFEHTTYNTNWSAGGNSFETFTQGSQSLAKRNAPGPFTAAPIVQGGYSSDAQYPRDLIKVQTPKVISNQFGDIFDRNQGSVVFWVTPEWNSGAGSGRHVFLSHHNWFQVYHDTSSLVLDLAYNQSLSVPISWTAGTTYQVVARWDLDNTLDGTNYLSLTVNGTTTYGRTTAITSNNYSGAFTIGGVGHATWLGQYPANAIIEGLTIYRRPLFDGTNGIDVGNGNELSQVWNGSVASSKDPTLVTGSWDVVFALPTNSSVGAMSSGTGEAWSHPHASNLLGGTNGAAGFMLNGTYTADGFADEGTPSSVVALSSTEKIYGGGYKVTSDAANEGIYKDITVTAGQDFVIRGLAHSDGTSVPKLILFDQTNGAEIGSLTGTTTSTRTAPNMLLFTGEAPTGCTTIRVKLINTAASGIAYWHQVEVIRNLLTNPSFASGSGDPWMPTGWSGGSPGPAVGELSSSADAHSGANSILMSGWSNIKNIWTTNIFTSPNGFYSIGGFNKVTSSSYAPRFSSYNASNALTFQHLPNTTFAVGSADTAWTHSKGVARFGAALWNNAFALLGHPSYATYTLVDDLYVVQNQDINLFLTPSSQLNSTETAGLRVDGRDMAIQEISSLSDGSGSIKFKYTPRHSAADALKFIEVTDAYIAEFVGTATDYIRLYWNAANTITLAYSMNGTTGSSTWNATGAIVAGTTYDIQIDYTGGSNMTLAVAGTTRITLSTIPANFAVAPYLAFWGSRKEGDRQGDALFAPATTGSTFILADVRFSPTNPSLAKRNGSSSGPFTAGVLVQGDPTNTSGLTDDTLSFHREKSIGEYFYTNFDTTQGSVALWWTPEYSYNSLSGSGLHYLYYANANYYLAYDYANDRYQLGAGGQTMTVASNIVAGTSQGLVARWDTKTTLDGTNYAALSIDDTHTYGITTQPSASVPATKIYVGSNGTTGAASGLIEGLTIYRRVLFDGMYGVNANAGVDEVTVVKNSGGTDPTLITGSWDIVFALPTNSSVGNLVTGTGEAWSHPHASNLLGGTNGAAGFMLNGTYTTDGFADEGTPTSVAALASTEKIYGGGYKVTSDAANEGIYKDITVTAGQDFVIRGLAHSDGTSVPKLILFDQTNGAEIGSLTGTTTSTRTAPNMLLFTGEAPDGKARGWISMTGQPADTQTVTIDTQTYIFKTSLLGTPNPGEAWVLIGAAYTNTADNLRRAITNAGTLNTNYKYGTGVTAHTVVTAAASGGNIILTAINAGASGNVALSETADNTTVSGTNLTGGQTATTTVRIKLVSTAASGTAYWHQVEVLENKFSNPSFEIGAGDPWIPTWWSSSNLEPGEGIQETTNNRSGLSSFKITYVDGSSWYEGINSGTIAKTTDQFFSFGFYKYDYGTPTYPQYFRSNYNTGFQLQTNYCSPTDPNCGFSMGAENSNLVWKRYNGIVKAVNSNNFSGQAQSGASGGTTSDWDDFYSYTLNPAMVIVSPSSLSSSTESDQLRVDGKDTYTHTLPSLTASTGTINFSYTPRHSAADVAKFGETTPYIAKLMSGATDYIALYWSAANTLRLEYQMNGGTVTSSTWTATGAISAGTTYAMQITYTGGGTMVLSVDGTARITLSSIPSTFADAPNIAYWGSNSNGANQGDAALAPEPISASQNTTSPYSKFATSSAKLVNIGGDGRGYVTSINPGNTNTHTLSAYVYDGTTGNVGGAVSATAAKLVFNGSVVTPSAYTDMGGGWWRLSYSAATANASGNYGVQALSGKTIYIDGVQLEEKAYATTYADGSLGTGYSWLSSEHDSSSTRQVDNLSFSATNNILQNSGSISFWIKLNHCWDGTGRGWNYGGGLIDVGSGLGALRVLSSTNNCQSTNQVDFNINVANDGSVNLTAAPIKKWMHYVITWDGSNLRGYSNGSLNGTDASYTMSTPSSFRLGTVNSIIANQNISDFRTFQTSLTASEVASLYYSGLGSHELQTDYTEQFSGQEGPVAFWKFDDGFGEIAYDSSNQGNNATISGALWSDDEYGSAPDGKSLQFDGTNDYVTKTYNNDIELDPTTKPFTVSTWFKAPSGASAQQTLISRYSSSGYKLYMNASGQVCFGVDDDSTWGPNDAACSTDSFADSEWHFITAVKETDSINVYVDGMKMVTTALTATGGLSGSNTTFYVGIDSDGSSNPWKGFIDEVRVYTYALNTTQIMTEYAARGSVKGISAGFIGDGAEGALGQGLVGYWKMDEASWNGTSGEVLDSSGNSKNGTSTNATISTGKYSNGGLFDADGDVVNFGNNFSMTDSDQFTVSAWFKSTGSTGFQQIVDKKWSDNYDSGPGYSLYIDRDYGGSVLKAVIGDGTSKVTAASPNSVEDTLWHHGVMVSDTKNLYLYLDGALVSTVPDTAGDLTTTNPFVIGASGHSTYSQNFKGNIDETRVYNRALSPAEVQALYNWAPGPIGYWKFDEGTGTSAFDYSGKDNVGTMEGSMSESSWTVGQYSSGLQFNGADYLNVNSSASIESVVSNKPWTVGFWAKAEDSGQQSYEDIAIGWGTHVSGGYNSARVGVTDTSFNFETYGFSATGVTGNLSEWNYITVSYDGQNIKQFLNGQQKTSQSIVLNVATSQPLSIGGSIYNYTTRSFQGKLDDIKLYNYARTSQQIVEDMNAGHPPPGSPVGSALVHLKFDEGYGETLHNSGSGGSSYNADMGGACPGATTCPSWNNNSKLDKGLSFDGAANPDGDYATMNLPGLIDSGTSSFSISAWLKKNANGGNSVTIAKFGFHGGIVPNASNSFGCMLANTSLANFAVNNSGVLGEWNHYVCQYDSGTGKLRLFVDGSLKGETTVTGTVYNYSDVLYIGGNGGNYASNFNVDELKIYNHFLDESQIQAEFNMGKATVMGALSTDASGEASNASDRSYCPPGDSTGSCAPVAEWKLDEGTGQVTNDTTGNANTGQLGSTSGSDTTDPVWTNGKIGKALSFDGSNDYVKYAGNNTGLSGNFAGTFEAWINPADYTQENQVIVGVLPTVTGTGNHAAIILSVTGAGSGRIGLHTGTCGQNTSTQVITENNNWYHVAVVKSPGLIASTTKIYINGEEKTTSNQFSNCTPNLAGEKIEIGAGWWDSDTAYPFEGQIDHVQIFNYARTPAQIAWDYNRGDPVAHYKMDECSGTTVHSSNETYDANLNGTWGGTGGGAQTAAGDCSTPSTAWGNGATGQFNASLNFDGTDDFITIPRSSIIEPASISYSAWVYRTTTSAGAKSIIGKTYNNDGAAPFASYAMIYDRSNDNKVECFLGFTDNSYALDVDSVNDIPNNTWTHITCTYDQATAKIYINGQMEKSVVLNKTLKYDTTSTGNLYIGAGKASPTTTWDGQIDDVQIFNYALTQDQIQTVYNNGAVFFTE